MLKTTLIAAAVAFSGLAFSGGAHAEDVIIQREAPVVVEPAPSTTSKTTVEKHGADCDSKSVHTENSAGDSKTVTQEDCD